MWAFGSIFVNIIIPIFILIAVGYTAQRILKMDLRTITKLNIYIFIPSILFVKIYETEVTWKLFGTIVFYVTLVCLAMFILGELVAKFFKYERGVRKAFVNSLLFFNSGNYGLPLVELAFHYNPLATTAQIFILLIQNITTNTFGVFQASSGNRDYKQAFKNMLIMPSLYVVSVVIILKAFDIIIPEMIMIPLRNISNGFVAVALITLGVQLAEVKINSNFKDIFTVSFIRLIAAPLLGFLLISFMGVEGILAKALILGVSTPSAVTTAIIAKEFDNEPEYASQIVFFTTLLSAVTVSGIIFLLDYL